MNALLALAGKGIRELVLAQAAALATAWALPLHLLCVASSEAARAPAEQALAAALTQARAVCATALGEVLVGRPHQALIDAAQAGPADLLVVGRHGGDAIARAWIGGVAQKVIGLAEGSVLVHVNSPNPKPAPHE